VRQEYQKALIYKHEGDKSRFLFYTGLIKRVSAYLTEEGIPHVVFNETPPPIPFQRPSHPKFEFRDYQMALMRTALVRQRGYIEAATGSGKTALAVGLISALPKNFMIVYLVHELTLLKQTKEAFEGVVFGHIGTFSGEHKSLGRVTVATPQSLSKLGTIPHFDAIFIDECHHLSKDNCQYANLLRRIDAPIRYGLTATGPDENEVEMTLVLEGLLGPKIGEFTIQEGIEKGVLAKPKVILRKLPLNKKIKELHLYQDVYEAGVVQNQDLTNAVIKETKSLREKGLTSLVLVTKIEHGEIIKKAMYEADMPVEFVWGDVEAEDRNRLRKEISNKEIWCIIANTVWKEGIDIPSLGAIINASGGKKERTVLQKIGRGLRVAPDKTEILLIDFFNPSHYYLVSHFGERITLYFEEGWI